MKSALLLSGGMDSIAIAYWKRPAIAVTLDYGQLPAQAEIDASKAVAAALGIQHEIVQVNCRALGSGDLAGTTSLSNAPTAEWWPYRNQLLLTLAAMHLSRLQVTELMIGTVATDQSSHKDGHEHFVSLMNQLVSFQEGGLQITAPAISLTTAELVRISGITRSLLCYAHSCQKSNLACGECGGCEKYRATMQELYEAEGLVY
ncbi:7-cyano-7-deazaguanine synthase [Hymenobacter chitinivorans]|uniref:7-cyano-7-deazaguanine synthase n=1 Tax=Hymenobacter chitinivorans DSM 11115 TaxID=1121954 RepID=A0A2M9BN93_9BACT|nr:7-cyano-7-deazaguanine synthase [Hymenobacter chitinivorans]PJJ59405.1 7-cyano-7-deazaguanine synthase [Hymenobacter chitinivorans DSM 11115]